MPHNAVKKVEKEDAAYRAYTERDMPQWTRAGRGTVPYILMGEKESSHRPLHVPGESELWRPTLREFELMNAHEIYAKLMEDDPPVTSSVIDDDLESSWVDRHRISELTTSRRTHLRNWCKQDSKLQEREHGPQLPVHVGQSPAAVDFLMRYDASKSGHRIAMPWKFQRTKGEHKARREVHDKLSKFLEDTEDNNIKNLAATLPERVHHGVSVRTDIRILKDYYETVKTPDKKHTRLKAIPMTEKVEEEIFCKRKQVGEDEEYDALEFAKKDELENLMHDPNALVGIYDKAEVQYKYDLALTKIVKDMKREGHNGTSIGRILEQVELSEEILEANLEAARIVLVRSKKLSPLDAGSKVPAPRQSLSRRQAASRRRRSAQNSSSPRKQAASLKQPGPPKRSPTRRQRPPNQNHAQVQEHCSGMGGMVRPSTIDGSMEIELPSPDWSPMTVAENEDSQPIPEGLEQLNASEDLQHDSSATVSVVLCHASTGTLVGTETEESSRNTSESSRNAKLRAQGESDQAGNMVRQPSFETFVATERSPPTTGAKRAREESSVPDEDARGDAEHCDCSSRLAQEPLSDDIRKQTSQRARKRLRRY